MSTKPLPNETLPPRSRSVIYGMKSVQELGNKEIDTLFVKTATAVTPKPKIPSILLEQSIIKDDHVRHFIQHGAEARNPYEKLVAKLEKLPVICISAFGSPTDAFGNVINYHNKDYSTLMKNNSIYDDGKTVHASLPQEYVLAAAIVAAQLGGPNSMVTSRVTLWSQDSIPSAPKPPATKLKTGKRGISGGVIPVDLSTTTNEGPNGTMIALPQNFNHRPRPEEKDITTVQWAKPLEQIMVGLDSDPADFILQSTPEEIQQGILKFKMNCADNEDINASIYQVNLENENNPENRKATVKPVNVKDTEANQPSWWDSDKFGDFVVKAREGYHVSYKKDPNQASFEPYDVYARVGDDKIPVPLSGDQDLFFIPRTEKYALGALGIEKIDTHANDGVMNLVDKLKEVHMTVLEQDFNRGDITITEMQKSIDNFVSFVNDSHNYIEALGIVTPYEAYFEIQLNNQIAKIRDHYQNDPEGLAAMVKQVQVDKSDGLKNIKLIDIDLNTAWYKEQPVEMSERVQNNLEKGFYVAPEILEMHVGFSSRNSMTNTTSADSTMLNQIKGIINELAKDHADNWNIYVKIEVSEHPAVLPGDKIPDPPYYGWIEVNEKNVIDPEKIISTIICADTVDSKKLTTPQASPTVLHITEKGITSTVTNDKVEKISELILDKLNEQTVSRNSLWRA